MDPLKDNRLRTSALTRRSALLGGAGLVGLGLAACSDNASTGGAGGGGETITLGYVSSWTDGLSTAYLLDNRLQAMGYNVEHQDISEPGALYAALAKGDIDVYPSAWPEVTHAEYMKEYGDDIDDLVTYYGNAKLTIAVPEYTDITSIDELKGNADMFGGQIIGIEPGAGLTGVTKDSMMPTYDLEDEYELVTSSTTAMLSELKKATDSEKDIVVTLWRPFWANSAFPVRDLEDPEGGMGETEGLHFLARKGFADDFADAAEFISGIELDDEQYNSLEDLVVNEYDDGKEPEAIDKWLEENPDVLPEVEEG
ncbi:MULTISPECIES: glycine betaine ABC transporter substrate-binding protein [Brachybacterium]|uniref:glycine betaine ABC transporter substrate-binding protein n=1 Tax=Brachybacterium TaxID=43668 RepID=UPI000BB95E43|nr:MULTISPECIES: glycine betaine ABC transporter substrate-binding protein [Brachybacterium]PCC35975.1 glycine/betaine ABC transporter substrate-binding protein [Brachybacterium alimentarium]RCS63756.1 glycine/betaine ABC transporter substrate-binding protein [Brachybacterium sp. JB7]RCS68046.1 glycine/betaine ABC transporter substrate-binding protein [Brachybacterium alimentarium]RCS84535.1 glycine/betaine ABC transporter substrate-binding protein [Brachybacterium alimentarium]RCS94036.1 glyc